MTTPQLFHRCFSTDKRPLPAGELWNVPVVGAIIVSAEPGTTLMAPYSLSDLSGGGPDAVFLQANLCAMVATTFRHVVSVPMHGATYERLGTCLMRQYNEVADEEASLAVLPYGCPVGGSRIVLRICGAQSVCDENPELLWCHWDVKDQIRFLLGMQGGSAGC